MPPAAEDATLGTASRRAAALGSALLRSSLFSPAKRFPLKAQEGVPFCMRVFRFRFENYFLYSFRTSKISIGFTAV